VARADDEGLVMAAKKHTAAPPSAPMTLGAVPIGHRARMLDGSIVLVAAELGGALYVRDNDGTGNGPYELPRGTRVLEVLAPELVAADRAPVRDPLAAA
jgi:hypothetical protein